MTVHQLGEVDHGERVRLALHAVEPNPEEHPKPPKAAVPGRMEMLEAMGALARILGFRMQLFAGFLGAVGLGALAVHEGTAMSMAASVIYDMLVFAPLAFIGFKRG